MREKLLWGCRILFFLVVVIYVPGTLQCALQRHTVCQGCYGKAASGRALEVIKVAPNNWICVQFESRTTVSSNSMAEELITGNKV